MHFSKSLWGSKLAITMRPVSIESTLLLFLLIQNFLGDTDGEADDSSDSIEDELYEDDEIDNNQSKTISSTKVDYATDIDLPYRTSSVLHTQRWGQKQK